MVIYLFVFKTWRLSWKLKHWALPAVRRPVTVAHWYACLSSSHIYTRPTCWFSSEVHEDKYELSVGRQELWAHWNVIFLKWLRVPGGHVATCSWQHPDTFSMLPCYFLIHTLEQKQSTCVKFTVGWNFLTKNNHFQKAGMLCGERKGSIVSAPLLFICSSCLMRFVCWSNSIPPNSDHWSWVYKQNQLWLRQLVSRGSIGNQLLWFLLVPEKILKNEFSRHRSSFQDHFLLHPHKPCTVSMH